MKMLTRFKESNLDWMATCEIYGYDDAVSTLLVAPDNKIAPDNNKKEIAGGDSILKKSFLAIGIVEIPISIENVSFFYKVSKPSTYFCMGGRRPPEKKDYRSGCYRCLVVTSAIPVLELRFHYRDEGETISVIPSRVSLEWKSYPTEWPAESKDSFLNWLHENCNDRLRNYQQSSYDICDFCEHEALEYWGYFHRGLKYDLVQLPPKIECIFPPIKDQETSSFFIHPLPEPSTDSVTLPIPEQSTEEFARTTLVNRWRELYTFLCPICMEEIDHPGVVKNPIDTNRAATLLPCNDILCSHCFTTYMKLKLKDIYQYRSNPFLCPSLDCPQREMPIEGFVKTHLNEEQQDIIDLWEKDVAYPRCHFLDHCLSPGCRSTGKDTGIMRRRHTTFGRGASSEVSTSTTFGVFCDSCNKTWCQLCLKRLDKGGRIPTQESFLDHYANHCNDGMVLRFCRRFLKTSSSKKEECRQKYPWIDQYASFRGSDIEAQKWVAKWVAENGQLCPKCGTGVERTEGCFHMQCGECAAHFCYECGGELHPPYYGSHHCWEE